MVGRQRRAGGGGECGLGHQGSLPEGAGSGVVYGTRSSCQEEKWGEHLSRACSAAAEV